jgi:hypothetical protein
VDEERLEGLEESLPRDLIEFPAWPLFSSDKWFLLPPKFSSLEAYQFDPIELSHCAQLPPSIREIHLPSHALSSELLLSLPKTLTFVQLSGMSQFDSMFWLVPNFLPNLKRFELQTLIDASKLEPMPKTLRMDYLERFRLYSSLPLRSTPLSPSWSNKITHLNLVFAPDSSSSPHEFDKPGLSGLLGPMPADVCQRFTLLWVCQLPSTLTHLNLHCRTQVVKNLQPHHLLPPEMIRHLPKSLRYCNLNEIGPISDAHLEHFPCANLQTLQMRISCNDGLSIDGLTQHLPRHSLTKLEIKGEEKLALEIKVQEKMSSAFPKLVHLYFPGSIYIDFIACPEYLDHNGKPMKLNNPVKPLWSLRTLQ